MYNLSAARYFMGLIPLLAMDGCKSASSSIIKDIGASPADVYQASYVVYLDSKDNMVHAGECPSPITVINRNCKGFKDIFQRSMSDFELGLAQAMLNKRGKGGTKPQLDPSAVKSLEDSIFELTSKLSSAGLSAADKSSFQSQLKDRKRALLVAKGVDLNADELKIFDMLLQKLNLNEDVTIDEGEDYYQFALAPFGLGVEICTTSNASYVQFQINAPATSKVDCHYKGSNVGFFVGSSTYNASTKSWSCSDWRKGNLDYEIDVIVDGVHHYTDEKSALSVPCK